MAAAPQVLRFLGRSRDLENSDIMGVYRCKDMRHGRAVYQQVGKSTCLYYLAQVARWVVDRNGVTDSEIVVAFADDPDGSEHPASINLVWNVWDSTRQIFVLDQRLFLVDAPVVLSLFGRDPQSESSGVNGSYELVGVYHGRPAYENKETGLIVSYNAPVSRWYLCRASNIDDNTCVAYAESIPNSNACTHPADPALNWNIFEPSSNTFVKDVQVRMVVGPRTIQVLGQYGFDRTNPSMYGRYTLAGVQNGFPIYIKPGTSTVIRHSQLQDRWLIDQDTEPGLLSWLGQWFRGREDMIERCAAFADAKGSSQPGHSHLEWHVLGSGFGRHKLDLSCRTTTAPLAVRVLGLRPQDESFFICGDYDVVGTLEGHPAYIKGGTQFAIRYNQNLSCWVITGCGLQPTDDIIAYADGIGALDEESPAGSGPWFVFNAARRIHLEDPHLWVSAIVNAFQHPTGPREATATHVTNAKSTNELEAQRLLASQSAASLGGA